MGSSNHSMNISEGENFTCKEQTSRITKVIVRKLKLKKSRRKLSGHSRTQFFNPTSPVQTQYRFQPELESKIYKPLGPFYPAASLFPALTRIKSIKGNISESSKLRQLKDSVQFQHQIYWIKIFH